MDLSELTSIVSKFDPLSEYSEDDAEIFKHPVPDSNQKPPPSCTIKETSTTKTTHETTSIVEKSPKTVRFPPAHLLTRCLVTGKVVPTREEQRAAMVEQERAGVQVGERQKQRRQKRAKQRNSQNPGGNLLDDELAFHNEAADKDPKSILTEPQTQSPELDLKENNTDDKPIQTAERVTIGPEDDTQPTNDEQDPEELALDSILLQACRNATINTGDVAPLQSVEKFAWQSRWAEEDRSRQTAGH